MKDLKERMEIFRKHKPEFLDILGFEDFTYQEEEGIYTCIFNPSEKLTHSNGTIVQGGFIAGMLDASMAQYILNLYDFKVSPLSLDIDVKYLLPCRPEKVEARSKILKLGKSIAFSSAELVQSEKLIATASSTIKLIQH